MIDMIAHVQRLRGFNVIFPWGLDRNGINIELVVEKIKNTRKIITKIFNIAKFTSIFDDFSEKIESVKLFPIDKWILAGMNKFIDEASAGYDVFDFIIPAQAARNFAVNIFASHYLEFVKNRAYNGDKAVFATLHKCLKAIIKILYPIIPFITYTICFTPRTFSSVIFLIK